MLFPAHEGKQLFNTSAEKPEAWRASYVSDDNGGRRQGNVMSEGSFRAESVTECHAHIHHKGNGLTCPDKDAIKCHQRLECTQCCLHHHSVTVVTFMLLWQQLLMASVVSERTQRFGSRKSSC